MTYKRLVPLVFLLLPNCKTSEEKSSLRQQQALEEAVPPQEPALADFAWETADLPACIGSRADSKVYVWRTQKTVRCDGGAWK